MANYTGNYIQIDPEVATRYVVKQLEKYDKMSDSGVETKMNPYNERIIMALEDGRQIEIPDDIQRLAIAKYVSENAIQAKHDRPTIKVHEISDDMDDEQSMLSVFFQITVCLVIIITILYLLTLLRKGVTL